MFLHSDDVYSTSLRWAKRFAVSSQDFQRMALEDGEPVCLLDLSVKGWRFLSLPSAYAFSGGWTACCSTF
jgi:hypothetical protein